jgi:hypothetical protein
MLDWQKSMRLQTDFPYESVIENVQTNHSIGSFKTSTPPPPLGLETLCSNQTYLHFLHL